jgi:hypothetical protein
MYPGKNNSDSDEDSMINPLIVNDISVDYDVV